MRTPPHLLTLVALSGVSALSMNVFLPSLPGMARDFQVDYGVMLSEDTLFRADVDLPADLIEGDYLVRIFLTRAGTVVDSFERSIHVRKAGLERFFYRMAQDQPLRYGFLSLIVAVVAGWGASTLFARLRW